MLLSCLGLRAQPPVNLGRLTHRYARTFRSSTDVYCVGCHWLRHAPPDKVGGGASGENYAGRRGNVRGKPNRESRPDSKRVIAEMRSPASVSTADPAGRTQTRAGRLRASPRAVVPAPGRHEKRLAHAHDPATRTESAAC